MKKIFVFFLIFTVIISCDKNDQVVEKEKINLFSEKAKVVGYLPSWNFGSFNKIEYCKLTHLNLAFANPDADGNLIMADVSNIINKARIDNPNIKISISIGGGSLTSAQSINWSNLIVSAKNRSIIVSKTVKYVLDNNFDGVDVDLEWEYVTTGYSEFIIDLNNELDKHSKIITAAFPAKTRYSKLNDAALNSFDFINIMAYDFTGPWNPSISGQHSSYKHAEESINFWTNSVGVSAKKLTVGVPFYGYDFSNSSNVSAFSFSTMVSLNKSYAEIDNVGSKYYNGRRTIKSKVKLASTKLSGIMIWELGQDSYNEYSLLKTIHKEYSNLGVKTTNLCNN